VWGSAPFQSVYQPAPGMLRSFPLTPEWYLVAAVLVFLTALTGLWNPLVLSLPILVVGTGVPIFWAARNAFRASVRLHSRSASYRLGFMALTTILHLLQPLARLWGRVGRGIRPWLRKPLRLAWPTSRTRFLWNERWQAPEEILESVHKSLIGNELVVSKGGAFDRWDLEMRVGVIGSARVRMAVEEHGQGKQLVRFRSWPRWSPVGILLVAIFALLAGAAAIDQSMRAGVVLATLSGLVALRGLVESAAACGHWLHFLDRHPKGISKR